MGKKGISLAFRPKADRRTFFARFSLFAALMALSTACSGPISAEQSPVELQCSVSGIESLKSQMTEKSVCDLFKSRLDQTLVEPLQSVQSVSSAAGHDWIKISVAIVDKRSATATLARKQGSGIHEYPEVAVDVMDKPIGQQELEMLAAQVAQLLSEKVEK